MLRSLLLTGIVAFALTGCTESRSLYDQFVLASEAGPDEAGLNITWFGTAAVRLDDGSHSLLIDPFVSRESTGPLSLALARTVAPDEHALRLWRDRIIQGDTQAVAIGHAHYDHVLDAAAFGKATGAPVIGSRSTERVVRAHGYANTRIVKAGDTYPAGTRFRIDVVAGKHGRPPLGIDLFDESVSADFRVPASSRLYGLGKPLIFHVRHPLGCITHIGSAGVSDGALAGLKTDILLLSLNGRGETDVFLDATVGVLRPSLVIAIHFDWLFDDLDKPLRVVRTIKLAEFLERMAARYPSVKTGILDVDSTFHARARAGSPDRCGKPSVQHNAEK